MCSKCQRNENSEEEKQVDDLKSKNNVDGRDNHVNNAWTDAETLLLLEAVLKHGDDWDLITQHVRTKSKLDCITRLIQLPFGEHMLGLISNKLDSCRNSSSEVTKAAQNVAKEQPEQPIADNEQNADGDEKKRIAEENSPARATKKRCLPSLIGVTDLLTEQVGTFFWSFFTF